ncbi:MAG TPA: NAD(P)-binding domain-containing protein, partial [Trebonia sp.]
MARLAVDAGFDVVLSNSRGPETLAALCADIGPGATAARREECAEAGDLVVISTPLTAYASLPAAALAGKVVLDTGNYYPERDGRIGELESGELTGSEYLGRHIPGAQVAKVFNNIFFKHLLNLARPAGAGDRSYLPVAGDDSEAKSAVTAFLDAIGYGAVDDGALSVSWRQQPGTPVYGTPYGAFENEKGTPASETLIR